MKLLSKEEMKKIMGGDEVEAVDSIGSDEGGDCKVNSDCKSPLTCQWIGCNETRHQSCEK